MSHDLPITIDTQASLLISTQIAEQIKLLISIGYLKPGDILPTVTQLAEYLQSNHTTIASVYSSLIEAGYLVAQRGRGTFVAQNEVVQQSLIRASLYQMLEPVFFSATKMGITPSEFGAIAYAKAVMLNQQQSTQFPVVFVECHEHDANSYFQSIQSALENSRIKSSLLSIQLEDLRNCQPSTLEKLRTAALVITTLHHQQEVSDFVTSEQEVIGVRGLPNLQMLTKISSLPHGTQVLLVCRTLIGSANMKRMLEQTGISHITIQAVGLKCIEQDRQILENADVVFASHLVLSYVRKLSSQPERVIAFSFGIDEASTAVLKARYIVIEHRKLSQTAIPSPK
jgi:DNA-binding transcriptional regulator YhcF (GntR family)